MVTYIETAIPKYPIVDPNAPTVIYWQCYKCDYIIRHHRERQYPYTTGMYHPESLEYFAKIHEITFKDHRVYQDTMSEEQWDKLMHPPKPEKPKKEPKSGKKGKKKNNTTDTSDMEIGEFVKQLVTDNGIPSSG